MKNHLVVHVLPDLSLAARSNEIYQTRNCPRHIAIDLDELSDEARRLVAAALSPDGTRLWRITEIGGGRPAQTGVPLRAWPLTVNGVIAALKSCLHHESHIDD